MPIALVFYELFKVVNRRIALLQVFFTLVGSAIEGLALLGHYAPLILLNCLLARLPDLPVSFVDCLAPGLAGYAVALLIGPGVAGISLCLWLLLKGVNVVKWHKKQALAVA